MVLGHAPSEAWLLRFTAATQPALHTMAVPSGASGSGRAEGPILSGLLASMLSSFAALEWAPPLEWLTVFCTVRVPC